MLVLSLMATTSMTMSSDLLTAEVIAVRFSLDDISESTLITLDSVETTIVSVSFNVLALSVVAPKAEEDIVDSLCG